MALTVALTGASGFIGGALAAHFRRKGHHVRALLRTSKKARSLEAIGVEPLLGRLDHDETLADLVRQCDVVIHCAGAIGGLKVEDFFSPNVQAVSDLVRICRSLIPLPKFILMSSLAAREPTLSPYAWSKREGEKALMSEAPQLPWVIFRPPAVYGPGDQSLLPLFRCMQYGVGIQLSPDTSRFSLLHVDDLCRAIMEWVENGGPVKKIFECDDGFPGGYTWKHVFGCAQRPMWIVLPLPKILLKVVAILNEQSSKIFGYVPVLTRGKVTELFHDDWVCHLTPDERAFSWQPQIQLKSGLRQLLTSDRLEG